MDQFMTAALEEARKGAEEPGIPIGAALADMEGRIQPSPTPPAILTGEGEVIDRV